jgi:hypothetical protein
MGQSWREVAEVTSSKSDILHFEEDMARLLLEQLMKRL